MKNVAIGVLFFCLNGPLNAQNRDIVFLHGFDSGGGTWNQTRNTLHSRYRIDTSAPSYSSSTRLGDLADNFLTSELDSQNDPVIVAHSMGGNIAREYLRLNGDDEIGALITIGTPHLGAPIADWIHSNDIDPVVARWVDWVAEGPARFLGEIGIGREIADNVLNAVGLIALAEQLNTVRDLRSGIDLKPGGPFMTTLNANMDATLPSAYYAIVGDEFDPAWLHLADAHGGGGVENGQTFRRYESLVGWYGRVAFVSSVISSIYYLDYAESGDFQSFLNSLRWHDLYMGFRMGFDALRVVMPAHYYYMTGIWPGYGSDLPVNDGFFPEWTQAPFSFPETRRFYAVGASHQEETKHPNALVQFERAFDAQDVSIPKR